MILKSNIFIDLASILIKQNYSP